MCADFFLLKKIVLKKAANCTPAGALLLCFCVLAKLRETSTLFSYKILFGKTNYTSPKKISLFSAGFGQCEFDLCTACGNFIEIYCTNSRFSLPFIELQSHKIHSIRIFVSASEYPNRITQSVEECLPVSPSSGEKKLMMIWENLKVYRHQSILIHSHELPELLN